MHLIIKEHPVKSECSKINDRITAIYRGYKVAYENV